VGEEQLNEPEWPTQLQIDSARINTLEQRFKLLESFADVHANHSRGCRSYLGQHIECTCGFDKDRFELITALRAIDSAPKTGAKSDDA
jgi:hypothetical protein